MTLLARPVPAFEDAMWVAFYAYCARGELRFQRCRQCTGWRHPPRPMCPLCHSERWEWSAATGRGRVHSWTIVHQAFHPGFAADVPYAIVLGEMEEGVRLIARLSKMDEPDVLALDIPLQVQFEPVSDEMALPTFSLARAGDFAPGTAVSSEPKV
ncbi:OB-fold domain-containing protein [Bradyrhizobium sp. B117]|uniref:Zn-ribbon domain-containing OB-fold protein n=1 Tax=Bradyrhizobium sp. B117 TaxID=3140246 RepID=UPI003183678C